jgi:hypothetical protein
VNITNEMDTDIYFILQNEYRGRGRGHHHKHDENPLSEYYKWADYWNKLSGSDLYSNITNSNYLLKTQVVPPVCPRCPNCPGSGVCTSCGGNGGSGTAGAPSKQEEDKKEESVGQFLKDSGSGVKDFAEDTGSGIKDFAEDTGKGLKTVAYDAASGAKGVAYDVAGGVKDVAYDVAGGVKDVAGGILGGVQRILTPHPSQVSGPNLGSGVGQHLNQNMGGSPHSQQFGIVTKTPQTTGSDFMSYFGALQPHGGSGNYVPVTADFSSFRR